MSHRRLTVGVQCSNIIIIIIIIIIIKNEKIRVTLCDNTAGALYIVNKMCVDGIVVLVLC